MLQNKVYTICRGNKTISIVHRNQNYVIGFRKPLEVRRVLYSMHPEPKFDLVRDHDISLDGDLENVGIFGMSLNIDVSATLFIPKCKGSILEPMNDGGFHVDNHSEESFLMFPIEKNLGIIMPYLLFHENDDEFLFKAAVLDPMRK